MKTVINFLKKTVIDFLKKGFSFIGVFIKKYPELLTIPIGIIIWELVRLILRADPENAPIDNGVVQIIPFTFIQFTIYLSLAWMFLGILFGTFRKYMTTDMKEDYKTLTKWQKIKLSYSVFFLLVFALVALSTALL